MIEKIKKIKLTPKKITFWFYSVVFILTIVILVFVALSLYRNFYLSITQSKEISVLREKVVIETVDIDKFKEIIEKLDKKIILKKAITINNLFD